jgi:hypothetical protein
MIVRCGKEPGSTRGPSGFAHPRHVVYPDDVFDGEWVVAPGAFRPIIKAVQMKRWLWPPFSIFDFACCDICFNAV